MAMGSTKALVSPPPPPPHSLSCFFLSFDDGPTLGGPGRGSVRENTVWYKYGWRMYIVEVGR